MGVKSDIIIYRSAINLLKRLNLWFTNHFYKIRLSVRLEIYFQDLNEPSLNKGKKKSIGKRKTKHTFDMI